MEAQDAKHTITTISYNELMFAIMVITHNNDINTLDELKSHLKDNKQVNFHIKRGSKG